MPTRYTDGSCEQLFAYLTQDRAIEPFQLRVSAREWWQTIIDGEKGMICHVHCEGRSRRKRTVATGEGRLSAGLRMIWKDPLLWTGVLLADRTRCPAQH